MVEKYPYSFLPKELFQSNYFKWAIFVNFQVYTSLKSNIWLALHTQLVYMDQPIWSGE